MPSRRSISPSVSRQPASRTPHLTCARLPHRGLSLLFAVILWTRVFWVIDLLFLTIFIVEISMRLYAWGFTYLRDVLNLVDMVIVAVLPIPTGGGG